MIFSLHSLTKKEKYVKILNSMIELGNSLGVNVVIEGVERDNQLKLINDKNIHSIQGFIYSKPLSRKKFEKFYRTFLTKSK